MKKAKSITERQKRARIRNFNKFRLRGALEFIVSLIGGKGTGASLKEQDALMKIAGDISNVLVKWKEETKNIEW